MLVRLVCPSVSMGRKSDVGKKLEDLSCLLIEGALLGLSAQELYGNALERCKEFSVKRIQRAALIALSRDGPHDKQVFEDLYAYAAYARGRR